MKKQYPASRYTASISGFLTLIVALCCTANSALYAQLPTNIDFSLGNFTNWLCYTGMATTGTPSTGPAFTSAVLSGPVAGPPSRHALTSGTGSDVYGGFSMVAPGGGTYSLKIGNNAVGAEAERVRYYIHVPAGTTRYSIQYQFAVVFEDPGHSPEDQPSFKVIAYDSATGAIIPSANNLYIAGPSIPGFLTSSVGAYVLYRKWTPCTVNLSGKGGQTVILEVTSSDCTPTGHFGYGYFDATASSNYLAPTVASCNLASNTIKLQAPPGYKYYQWFNQSFSSALNSATDTSSSINLPIPATPEYYNLVLIPYFTGGAPDTIRTNVLNGFGISTSPATACINPGASISLSTSVTGAGSYTYQWSGDSSLSAYNTPNPIASPTNASLYFVKVTDTNGCFRMDTVRVNTGLFTVHAGPDTTTCLGTSVNLSGSVTPAFSGTYTWAPASNLSGTSVLNPVYTPAAVGIQQYVLRVDSGSCSKYDTLNIRTLPNSFLTGDTAVCAGTSVIPFVQGDTAFSYAWSPSGRLSFTTPAYPGSDQHPAFNADTTTIFTITASYPGCPNIVKQLTVNVEPIPVVNLSDTVFKSASSPISISASAAPSWFSPYTYTWNANPFIDSVNKAHINFSGTTDTTLVVTVTTPLGCAGSDSVYVVNGSNIMSIPNAFVPGSAKNGTYRVVHMAPDHTLRSFRIYNRWGKKVFETANISDAWDGTFNGDAQPMGVYVYTLEAVSAGGKTVRQTGTVTLVR